MGVQLKQRFIELFSARSPNDRTNGSSGSGYLLGRGMILTARHLLAPPDWPNLPPILDITARPVVTLRPDRTWLEAELAWTKYEELARGGPDVSCCASVTRRRK
jgi:hypothetical protein